MADWTSTRHYNCACCFTGAITQILNVAFLILIFPNHIYDNRK